MSVNTMWHEWTLARGKGAEMSLWNNNISLTSRSCLIVTSTASSRLSHSSILYFWGSSLHKLRQTLLYDSYFVRFVSKPKSSFFENCQLLLTQAVTDPNYTIVRQFLRTSRVYGCTYSCSAAFSSVLLQVGYVCGLSGASLSLPRVLRCPPFRDSYW